jgi:hypothetical protein
VGGKLKMNYIDSAKMWYHNACSTIEPIDQFITIWISFNIICDQEISNTEHQRILDTVRKIEPTDLSDILLMNEVQYFLYDDSLIEYFNYNKGPLETRTLENYISEDPYMALYLLLDLLNNIRYNLFKRNKYSLNELEILPSAIKILMKVVHARLPIHIPIQPERMNYAKMLQSKESEYGDYYPCRSN